jgi:hypothetical protein
MEPVERIKRLTQYLPKGDIALAHTFIDSRDFESLQELVDSAIVKTKRSISSNNTYRIQAYGYKWRYK